MQQSTPFPRAYTYITSCHGQNVDEVNVSFGHATRIVDDLLGDLRSSCKPLMRLIRAHKRAFLDRLKTTNVDINVGEIAHSEYFEHFLIICKGNDEHLFLARIKDVKNFLGLTPEKGDGKQIFNDDEDDSEEEENDREEEEVVPADFQAEN